MRLEVAVDDVVGVAVAERLQHLAHVVAVEGEREEGGGGGGG